MDDIKTDFSLKNHNTFKINVSAKTYIRFSSTKQLKEILAKVGKDQILVLGGGSNILLTKNINGVVLHNNINGITVLKKDDKHVVVKVGAGEVWHNFVLWSVQQNYSGIENLALIPGSVGASPIQNIGAYGIEVKDTIEEVIAIEIKTGKIKTFKNIECEFQYRDSIFKNKIKGKYIITEVIFRLNKSHLNITSYGEVEKELKELKLNANPKNISTAIINIRSRKLPDPQKLANCGSFFKNPTIETSEFEILKKKYPNIIGYKISEKKIKLAAGWLIDNAGLKGYRIGDAGVHINQALVLVNYGRSTGEDILKLSNIVKNKIRTMYNIELENEVTIL
jgi:UDP-N-acetylmuramate dehydrogenase